MEIDQLSKAVRFLGIFSESAVKNETKTEKYCILPTKKNPRWIVPIRNNLFISSLALYQPSLLKAKLLKQIAVFAAKGRVSNLLLKNRVYFQKDDIFVKRIFEEGELNYAIFTGTEGSHRKITVQVMDKEGKILGYIKVSNNKDIDRLLQNEVDILNSLLEKKISSGLLPKVIFHGKLNGINVLILSTLKNSTSSFSSRLSLSHISFLTELFYKTSKKKKFAKSIFFEQFCKRIEYSRNRIPDHWYEKFQSVFEILAYKMGDQTIPFGVCHRDFTPWNTFYQNGKLFVFDWEYAEKEYPPLLDIFHFIIQDGIIVRKLNPEDLMKRILKNRNLIGKYCDSIGIDKSLINLLLFCYLCDISLLYIERERGMVSSEITKLNEIRLNMISLIAKRYSL